MAGLTLTTPMHGKERYGDLARNIDVISAKHVGKYK